MGIISSKFQSGRVVDALGNGAYIYTDNDSISEYAGFGFTAGFDITYDGIFYKEWGRLYFDSNSNGIYEGTHVYTDEASGIIDFGDMVHSFTVLDAAVCMSYLGQNSKNCLNNMFLFLKGFR